MSSRSLNIVEVVSRYAAGYFPLYDARGRFYWERPDIRAVLPVNAVTAGRARRMAHRLARRFEIRHTTAVDAVIGHLRDVAGGGVKENSWVKAEVVGIYNALHAAGILQTVEAWEVPGDKGEQGRLVGGLLGIVMPGTFIAETMFGLVPEASKACLCRLVMDCLETGVSVIDVQTPHDLDTYGQREKVTGRTAHPCVRLGEETITLAKFMREFREAWAGAFAGGEEEWLAAAAAVGGGGVGAKISPKLVEQARRHLWQGRTGERRN